MVRTELQCTPEQISAIEQGIKQLKVELNDQQSESPGFRPLSETLPTEQRAAERSRREQLIAHSDTRLTALLTPKQANRLEQLVLQLRLRSDPADALLKTLTMEDQQTQRLQNLQREYHQLHRTLHRDYHDQIRAGKQVDVAKLEEAIVKLDKVYRKSSLAVLTAQQSEELVQLQGQQFEFAR